MSIEERNKKIEEVFRDKKGAFMGMASQYVGYDNAEDVLQTSMKKCCDYFDRYDSEKGASLSTWIGTILKNTCLDYLRSKENKAKTYLNDLSLMKREKLEFLRSYKQIDLAQKEREEIIKTNVGICLLKLKKEERDLLKETYLEKKNQRITAKENNISWATHRSRIRRAKEKFRKHYAGLMP